MAIRGNICHNQNQELLTELITGLSWLFRPVTGRRRLIGDEIGQHRG
jgi:hypothetical protein